MPEKTLAQEFVIGLVGGAVPSLIVYFLTARQTKSGLKRQQAYSDISALIEKVEATEQAACSYYLAIGGTPQSHIAAMHVNGQVSSITKHISDLRTAHPYACDQLQQRAMNYRKALTDGDFQSASREAYGVDHGRFARMRTASNDLKSALRQSRDALK